MIILMSYLIVVLGHVVGLLLDMVALLILIRASGVLCAVPVLAEVNAAGRPLVDRTVTRISNVWRRLIPNRPLVGRRALLVAWLAVILARWLVNMITVVVAAAP